MAKTAATPVFDMAITLTTYTMATFTDCTRGMWMNAQSKLTQLTPALARLHMLARGTLWITFTDLLVGTRPFRTEIILTISSTVTYIIHMADTVMITVLLSSFSKSQLDSGADEHLYTLAIASHYHKSA